MNNIHQIMVIRKSKRIHSLVLLYSLEGVYRIFYKGIEKYNGLDFNEVSDSFDKLEKIL